MIGSGQDPAPLCPSKGGWPIDFVYRITGLEGFVHPDHPLWKEPLPALRKTSANATPREETITAAITYGDYFRAVSRYLRASGRDHFQKALLARGLPSGTGFRIQRIEIHLEKHGEFYHPAHIRVPFDGKTLSLVLNVAVTSSGRFWMASEIEALRKVAERLPPNSIPAVYGQAAVTDGDQEPLAMFLADWFEGFYEFHLSTDPRNGRQAMVVWDTSAAPFFLPERQQGAVYRQAAFLLTRAFNPLTTEQIYPWHHASGDFVLRTSGTDLELRLITVRQYAPTMGDGRGELNAEARLSALLVFFLNLTIRNRLDRLDGTGLPAWGDEAAVPETVQGFFDALEEDQSDKLRLFIESYSVDELMELLVPVAERYRLMPMEKDLLERHLASHGKLLHKTLQRVFQAQ